MSDQKKPKDLKSLLFQDISVLRNGYGFHSNILDALNLTELLGIMNCADRSPDHMASRFLAIIKALMPGPETEVLLAALNLLDGYGHIPSSEERRIQYYIDCFPDANPEGIKGDTIYRRENKTIKILVDKIIKALEEKKLDEILKKASRHLMLPKPRYTVKGVEEQMALEMAITVDVIAGQTENIPEIADGVGVANTKLDQQSRKLEELTAGSTRTHQSLDAISEQVKTIPAISTGVNEANTKLDELSKISSRLDRFDNIVDAQLTVAINSLVYEMLGGNISRYTTADYEKTVVYFKEKFNHFLTMEFLSVLPADAFAQVDEFYTNNPDAQDELVALILQKIAECGIDANTLAFNVMARFTEISLSVLEEDEELIEPCDATPENEKPETTVETTGENTPMTGEDVAAMTDEELDNWLDDLLNNP